MNVLDAALDRIHNLYRQFDTVVVSFSGGKDSTTILNLCIEVATKIGRLPVEAVFIDEEAITDETVDYVRRVMALPTVNLKWYCLPVKHRNACSRTEIYWFPWDPDKKDLWVRPMPPEGITKLKNFTKGIDTHAEIIPMYYGLKYGRVADVTGLRAQESVRRRRMAENDRVENYIGAKPLEASKGNVWHCYPIYDWSHEDVWLYAGLRGFDYNRVYDTYSAMGIPLIKQRVCPPWGEEPLCGLHQYAECAPELWAKMIYRVPGCNTAARYAKTELYGRDLKSPPEGMTWEQFTWLNLERWEGEAKIDVAKNIKGRIIAHKKRTKRSLPQEVPDPLTGISWKYLAKVALSGDFKGRKRQMSGMASWETAKKMGIMTTEGRDALSDDELTRRFELWKQQNNVT